MQKKSIILIVSCFLLSSCIGHYRYESAGTVNVSGESRNALLYWYADDGRRWYGKRYRQVDTDLELIVCETTPKSFEPDPSGKSLQLSSRSGDRQIARVETATGEVVLLPEPKRLVVGSDCGHISLSGDNTLTDDLVVGTEPQVFFICDNPRNPVRYPQSRRYQFDDVYKVKVP